MEDKALYPTVEDGGWRLDIWLGRLGARLGVENLAAPFQSEASLHTYTIHPDVKEGQPTIFRFKNY